MTDRRPRVSVIMAAYNGATYLDATVRSVLDQTLTDFELVVVDDASQDATPDILARFADRDSRIRVLRNDQNEGVVAARNRALAAARAPLIASLDHDDLSQPVRLERQAAALEADPGAVLCCSDARQLLPDGVGRRIFPGTYTHRQLHWRLHLSNPIVQSTIMFRKDTVERLGAFMRPGFEYADDFDFYHRLSRYGRLLHLPECLIFYRLHGRNAATRYSDVMAENARKVLAEAYEPLLGKAAPEVAGYVARYVAQKRAPRDASELDALADALNRLLTRYSETYPLSDAEFDWMAGEARAHLEASVEKSIASGRLRHLGYRASTTALANHRLQGRSTARRFKAALHALLPEPAKAVLRPLRRGSPRRQRKRQTRVFETALQPAPPPTDMPPRLVVVVDTEAEFDWSQPFDRGQTAVANIQEQWRAQAIFDRYGIRPYYLVDYPVATNPKATATLRAMRDRESCHVGAHLQPWTTPPFHEDVSTFNSYAGNLPPELEHAKLIELKRAIQQNFGVTPTHFKAGRYGLGPATHRTLQTCGFHVDFSIMPGADYRGAGGPSYLGIDAIPYVAHQNGQTLREIPMTRNYSGVLAAYGQQADAVLNRPTSRRLGVPGVLARLNLLNCVPLTAEGVPAQEATALVDSMLARGYRLFVLHYHSSSLLPGYTPYTMTEADRDLLVARIAEIVRHVIETRGGLPGLPQDGALALEATDSQPPKRAVADEYAS